MKRVVLAALLVTMAWPTWPGQAADIRVSGPAVTIDGDIAADDFETFQENTASLEKAEVILRGAGD
jgi:hypothetical protein